MNEKRKYTLFAFGTNDNTIELAQKERFCRITPRYVLIYSDTNEIIEEHGFQSYIIIGESEKDFLNDGDKEWLFYCNLTIIAEEASKNEELILQNMDDTLKELEEALSKEADKLSGVE